MGAFFSDLQEDGRKRWYNVVADRHWELQQVAKLYRCPLITRGGVSHVEVPQRVRQQLSYMEGNTKKRLSSYSSLARDAERNDLGSDYFLVRRVSDAERDNKAAAVTQYIKETGGRTLKERREGSSFIDFEPQGGGIQE